MEFSKEDLRKLIYFHWKSGKNAPQSCRLINNVLGNGTVSESTCLRWINKYEKGDFNVSDAPRQGRPSVDLTDDITRLLSEDPYATCNSMAISLGTCKKSVANKLHEMGKSYRVNKWLPHKLTAENKATRQRICGELLVRFNANDFLSRIVTVDETWVVWDNTGRSYHNRSWYGAGDNPTTSVIPKLTNKKHLLSVFWDSKGVILLDVLPQGTSLNSEIYCNQLDKLQVALREKRRRIDLTSIYYLQENAKQSINLKWCYFPTLLTPQTFLLPIFIYSFL